MRSDFHMILWPTYVALGLLPLTCHGGKLVLARGFKVRVCRMAATQKADDVITIARASHMETSL